MTGLREKKFTLTSPEACLKCQTYPSPTPTTINPVIASHLFHASAKLIDLGGKEPCDLEKAKQLQSLALENLKKPDTDESHLNSGSPRMASYDGPCSFLGKKIGQRDCASCRGRVTLKEFECHHPAHTSTVIRECSCCADYEARLKKASIKTWAVGVTTAPRRKPNLSQMIRSLNEAGWSTPIVFAEPDSDLADLPSSVEICQRTRTLGAWPNFLLALTELVLREPHVDAYFMCQDDTVFCLGLRKYLEKELWPDEHVGVISLHTPSHQAQTNRAGFFHEDVGWGAWGAMAFIFPNSSARAFLRDPAVINHRNRGMGEGLRNVDSVVGNWCRSNRIPFFLHSPSLCEHIGETTTLWSKDSLDGKRSSADFPGQHVQIGEFMKNKQSAALVSQPNQKFPANLNCQRSSKIAIVLRTPNQGLIDQVEAQELQPHEKYLITCSTDDVPEGWFVITDESRLASATSAWFAFLEPVKALPSTFVADLNNQLAENSIKLHPNLHALVRREALTNLNSAPSS